MATTNRVYILVAFVLSAIGAVFNIVSLSTEEWITGKAVWLNGTDDINYINYGLFQGNYKRAIPFRTNYQVTMTCNFKNNICALLCALDSTGRQTLLDDLYHNKFDPNYAMDNCSSISKYYHGFRSFANNPVRANPTKNISKNDFINAGVWLSTLIFIVLAAIVGFFASILGLYNAVLNPIQYFLSVKSLFIYNAIAFCSSLIYMTLWGTMYIIRIFHNIGIYDTIVGSINSDKTTFLGYSYWISFIPLVFYAGSIASLYYREYLNERDPKQKKVNLDADSTDPGLYLY